MRVHFVILIVQTSEYQPDFDASFCFRGVIQIVYNYHASTIYYKNVYFLSFLQKLEIIADKRISEVAGKLLSGQQTENRVINKLAHYQPARALAFLANQRLWQKNPEFNGIAII